MSAPRLKHFGWGREGEGLTAAEEAFVLARAEARFGTALKQSASVPSLNEVTDATIVGKLAQLAKDLAQREGLTERGYRLVINTNADAGQTVFHLHMHLLGGRKMSWPPG